MRAESGAGSHDDSGAEAHHDGYQSLLHLEATQAMQQSNFARARHFYQLLIKLDPTDAEAHREAGRAAHALGEFELAVQAFGRATALRGGAPDPELHYLRGEAFYGLNRTRDAEREHAQAIAEIGKPNGRMETLWLARIFARRGELAKAESLYETLEPLSDKLRDEEVTFSRIEARIFSDDWAGAEKILRDYLQWHPEHKRARETLAWVLEVRGEVGEEVALRRELAGAGPISVRRMVNHGRALERAYDYDGALVRYRKAQEIDPDPDLGRAIDRLKNRVSPEVAAGAALREDPTGTALEWRAGAAVPLTARHLVSLVTSYETAEGRAGVRSSDNATATGSVLLGVGYDVTAAIRVSANRHALFRGEGEGEGRESYHLGSGFDLRTAPGRLFQAHADAELNMPWREAATTIREGGRISGATARGYFVPIADRLVIEAGGQARRVSLAADDGDEEPTAHQFLLFGGADVFVWADPSEAAGGEVLDEKMLWPAHVADSVVLSYRHYDGFTDGALDERVVLAPRVRIDELSAVARKVVGKDGALGVELAGGAGYDWARELRLWRVGGALLVSPAPWGRLTLRYDVATESSTGLVGRRHTGWLSFHVDL